MDENLFKAVYIPWFMVVEGVSYETSLKWCLELWDNENYWSDESEEFLYFLLDDKKLRSWAKEKIDTYKMTKAKFDFYNGVD